MTEGTMYILMKSSPINLHYYPILCSSKREVLEKMIDEYNETYEKQKARELAKPIHHWVDLRTPFKIEEAPYCG